MSAPNIPSQTVRDEQAKALGKAVRALHRAGWHDTAKRIADDARASGFTVDDGKTLKQSGLSPAPAPLKELAKVQRAHVKVCGQVGSPGELCPCFDDIAERLTKVSALSLQPPTSRAPESIRLALDALESDATDAMREEAFNRLRDDFYPIDGPPFGSPQPPSDELTKVRELLNCMESQTAVQNLTALLQDRNTAYADLIAARKERDAARAELRHVGPPHVSSKPKP